jgi:CheY-like chemotaxis protein
VTEIVLVEDRSLVGRDIKNKLEGFGYTVTDFVDSGEKTLEAVRSNHPDLILMDVNIKGEMDGVETVNKIFETHDVSVIYMTAYSEERIIDRMKQTEAEGYLLKPIQERDLETMLQVIIDDGDRDVAIDRGEFFPDP